MTKPAIAILIDREDWHATALMRAFAEAGADPAAYRLSEIAFTTTEQCGMRFPNRITPQAVVARQIDNGSFEQVTRRLSILHALRERGVPVVNDARAIERCVDKSMTCFLLQQSGIPTPPGWTVEGKEAALAIMREHGGKMVLKPLFGSQGRGLQLVNTPEDLPEEDAVANVYHLQQFVPVAGEGFHDHRILVCFGEPVAAMTRTAEHWITNLHLGAKPSRYTPSHALASLAVRAADSVGAQLAGVDILFGRDGTPYVLEVNSMPGWRGLQTVSDVNISAHLAACVLRLL